MRKGKRSHPLRFVAVDMMRTGQASPTDIRRLLMVSRQLVRYWCVAAGLRGKLDAARDQYLAKRLLDRLPTAKRELDHADIKRLRAKLARRAVGQDQTVSDAHYRSLSGLPPSSDNSDLS